MLDLILVLAILALLGASVGNHFYQQYLYDKKRRFNDIREGDTPPVFGKKQWGMIVGAIFLSFVNMLWFNAELGKYYVGQDIFGDQKGVTEAGPTACIGCGMIALRDFDRLATLTLKGKNVGEEKTSENDNLDDGEGQTSKIVWEVPEGAYAPAECRFADNVVAYVSGTFNFPMPSNKVELVNLANQFTSKEAFVDGVALPAVQNIIRVACRMTTAQDFYAGNGGVLETAIQEMLVAGGKYEVLVKAEERKLSYGEENKADGLNASIMRPDAIVYESEIVRNEDGTPVVTPLKLAEFKMNPTSSITDVTPEPGFSRRLAKARDVAAKQNLAERNAQLAAAQEAEYEAKGRADLAKKNADLKLQQADDVMKEETEAKKALEIAKKQLTEAERDRDVAIIKRQTAAIDLETAELTAAATLETGTADATVERLKSDANDNLEMRLKYSKEQAIGVAAELKDSTLVPLYYFGGSEGGEKGPSSATDTLTQLMTLQIAQQQSANRTDAEKQAFEKQVAKEHAKDKARAKQIAEKAKQEAEEVIQTNKEKMAENTK